MKASELIKFALVNGFYVRNGARDGETSEYMCHAIEYCFKQADASLEDASAARGFIMKEFKNQYLTLFTHMGMHNKKYKSYKDRWGHDSKACFNLRVKWFEALILKLESKGL